MLPFRLGHPDVGVDPELDVVPLLAVADAVAEAAVDIVIDDDNDDGVVGASLVDALFAAVPVLLTL